jgi:hypothetical protein
MLVCVFIAFSLHRESPDLILGDEPLIYEVVFSLLVSEKDRGTTHSKHLKIITTLTVRNAEPIQDYSSFLRWQPNLFDPICNYGFVSAKVL